jgi:coenzyme Q-binding protein COQ10
MTEYSERRRVPYTPQQMFDLVADVAAYPKFIPWIAATRIKGETPKDGPGKTFEADMVVSFKVFRESYTSLVETFPDKPDGGASIDVRAISGPFNKLLTRYDFHPAGENECDMVVDVDFAFNNRLLQAAAGKAFGLAMRKVAGAFEERAKELYG